MTVWEDFLCLEPLSTLFFLFLSLPKTRLFKKVESNDNHPNPNNATPVSLVTVYNPTDKHCKGSIFMVCVCTVLHRARADTTLQIFLLHLQL